MWKYNFAEINYRDVLLAHHKKEDPHLLRLDLEQYGLILKMPTLQVELKRTKNGILSPYKLAANNICLRGKISDFKIDWLGLVCPVLMYFLDGNRHMLVSNK